MKQIIIILTMVLAVSLAFGQAVGSAPTVSGVQMVQQGGIVRVTFNLSFDTDPVDPRTGAGGAANTNDFLNQENYRNPVNCKISLAVSNDGGTTYKVYPNHNYLSGDIGSGVTVGEGKEIIWNIRAQYDAEGEQGIIGENYRARVIARRDDEDSGEFVAVQGTAGVTFNPGGDGFFTPATDYHVSLSSFQIGRHEVTQAEWTAVMGGIYDPDWTDYGQSPNHPAYRIIWFDAIEYCNRRSLMEGLTPCYSYAANGTNPDDWTPGWNTNDANHTNVSCNWEANGYRLSTEMEREYAMRGGVRAGTVSFNYTYAGINEEGQLGNYSWYSANNVPDGLKAVGTKLPNELGLYDMGGNVWNWCWDRRDGGLPTGTVTDPKGKDSGTYRVKRGGAWNLNANECSVSYRNQDLVTLRGYTIGFRLVRTLN